MGKLRFVIISPLDKPEAFRFVKDSGFANSPRGEGPVISGPTPDPAD